jgi:hypothetical protein
MLSQKRLDVIQLRTGFDNKWLLKEVGMAVAQSKVSSIEVEFVLANISQEGI